MKRTLVCFGLVLGGSTAGAQGLTFVLRSPENGIVYDQLVPNWSVASAAGDIDGDGDDDLLFCGGTSGAAVYLNNGDKSFTDVTDRVLPADFPNAAMAVFIDVDNDGDNDLGVARWYANHLDTGFEWYYNHGGRFRRDPMAFYGLSDLAREWSFSGALCLSDVDQDGMLDVVRMCYTGRGFCLRPPSSDVMRLGGGPLSFCDRSAEFGANIEVERRHWAAIMADFNNDGLQDLHAAIDVGHDYQARSLGGGHFTDVSVEANVTNVGQDMGLAQGDIDNDGDIDIFSTNIEYHVLYVNDGTGRFTNQASARGVLENGSIFFDWGWGTQFEDLDNDGDLDLVMVDSGPGMICLNGGDGYFTRDDSGHGANLRGLGLLLFDYDVDGDVDILTTGRLGVPKLYENQTPHAGQNHWLTIRLRGQHSNRPGVGARIYATIDGVRQMREMVCGQSFITGVPVRAHFGLGPARTVDLLEVHWPSGVRQTFRHVAGDRRIEIDESGGFSEW